MAQSAHDPRVAHFAAMPDPIGYLARLTKSELEKLRVKTYVPANASTFLDVGCADGAITIALAQIFPEIQFVGVDLDSDFIAKANEKVRELGLTNVRFVCDWMRNLLKDDVRYDVVQFMSVEHEFFSYGEGISSVLKSLADAHELLNIGGVIIVRDMVLEEYTKQSTLHLDSIRAKIMARIDPKIAADFIAMYGDLDSIYQVNHLLLKYMYTTNWERELAENYVAVVVEQYKAAFNLLGMVVQDVYSYTLAFLVAKWKEDFDLSDEEIRLMRSTTFLTARKVLQPPRRLSRPKQD
jgi:SAM-dependent methyltransferase